MNNSNIEMSKLTPTKGIPKEYLDNHKMPLKREEPPHSSQLPLPHWDNHNREFFYTAARNTAHIFYARIQKETEEFLYHLEKQTDSLQKAIPTEVFQNTSVEEDEALTKLKYLLMIHTTCSQITNLLVNSP